MKRIFLAAIIIALIIGTIRPSAGQLTINGDVSVVSNLTAYTILTTNGGMCTIGGTCTVRGDLEIRQGFGLGYLYGKMWGSEIGFLQAYANTNDILPKTQLGLNPYGGQIGIGTFDTIDEYGSFTTGVTVGPIAKFESDVEVDGKLNTYGGMDPPYVLLDSETRSNIANRVAREVPPSKQTGAALFWNSQTKQLEVYVASEGAYYSLAGQLLGSINPPMAANSTVTTGYRIDPVTGSIISRDTMHTPHWQVKSGYRFNSLTGVFSQIGSDSNSTSETVSAQEALELK